MKSTRAEFLHLAMLAGTAAVVAPRAVAGTLGSAAAPAPACGPTPERLESLRDPAFWILGANGQPQTKLLLERVEDHPSCARTRQFTLKFTCPGGARLAERAYPVSHSELGHIQLHLVPAASDADPRVRYRAAFNLLVPA